MSNRDAALGSSILNPSDREASERQALVVLVGITAGARKRRFLTKYLVAHCDLDLFVPDIPYRKPIREAAEWLSGYLNSSVGIKQYSRVHCIAYIGAKVLLHIIPEDKILAFERMVYFRGPYQELVPAKLVALIGKPLAGQIFGKSLVSLSKAGKPGLPSRHIAKHEALIVEKGRSRLAKLLNICDANIPKDAWCVENLLPSAEQVLTIPQSHDDVYTSPTVLDAALSYIRQGYFPPSRT